MNQLVWGLTCIQYHQGVRICIPSLLGKSAARASAIATSLSQSYRVPGLDALSYRTGDEATATVHYLWIAILNKKIYIGLPNSPSMTSRVWSAIFEYLGKSLELKDRAGVDVVLIATQHNINPISGILSLAYISLLAQGTDPFSISNLIFHGSELVLDLLQLFARKTAVHPVSSSSPERLITDPNEERSISSVVTT